eukprot:5329104-Alexandrium_andersonii.AAC.1
MEETNEYLVGAPEGAQRARAARRRPREYQLDVNVLQKIQALPWDPLVRAARRARDRTVLPEQPEIGEEVIVTPNPSLGRPGGATTPTAARGQPRGSPGSPAADDESDGGL